MKCQRCDGKTSLLEQYLHPYNDDLVLCLKCRHQRKGPYDKRTRSGKVRAKSEEQKVWNV